MSPDEAGSPTPSETRPLMSSDDGLPLLMLLAGVACALSGQNPTGNIVADLVLSGGFGVAVVWLSRFASTEALMISAVLALFFTGFQLPGLFIATVAAAVAALMRSRWPLPSQAWRFAAGVTSAFTALAVLNLPNIRYVGTASLLAIAAISPIAVTALRAMPPTLRKQVRTGCVWAAGAMAVATALTFGAALSVRNQVELGIEKAQDGVAALQAGDQPGAVELLEAAQENFDAASDRLGGPLTWPSRYVPVVAQHSRAFETAADQGSALARTAVRTVRTADVEQIRGRNGEIDLDLVERVNVELQTANLVLQDARRSVRSVRTAWLLPLLDSRLESVEIELASTNDDIDLANHATATLPGILGADAPRRYLILFVQPAESREFGGFVGAYGLLEADKGRLNLAESGSISPDIGVGRAEFTDPTAFPAYYRQAYPHQNPQNLTAIADLGTIARAAADLVPQWREDPNFTIDGVVTIDPYALAGFLELTGPIELPGRATPIDATNVVDFLLRGQYLEFEGSQESRQDILNVLAGVAFARLLEIDLPGPERLGEVFGPLARSDRLAFATFDDFENQFLDRVFLSADLPLVPDTVELIGAFGSTAAASKIDAYSTRSMSYVVEVDPATGEVRGRMDIAISNDAPPDAPEYVLGLRSLAVSLDDDRELPIGANVVALGVYTNDTVTDLESGVEHFEQLDTETVLGYERSWIALEIPLGDTAHVTFATTGQVAPGRYDLLIAAQQTATIGTFELTVRPTPGWVVVADDVNADGSWTTTEPLDVTRLYSVTFAPAGEA